MPRGVKNARYRATFAPNSITQRFVAPMAALLLALAAASIAVDGAVAQSSYPDHPVRVIVPFGPGGVADITARLVADKLSDKMGQHFVIENMPGAGGIAAARAVIAGGGWLHAGVLYQRHRDQRSAVQRSAVRSAQAIHADLRHRLFRSGLCQRRDFGIFTRSAIF